MTMISQLLILSEQTAQQCELGKALPPHPQGACHITVDRTPLLLGADFSGGRSCAHSTSKYMYDCGQATNSPHSAPALAYRKEAHL